MITSLPKIRSSPPVILWFDMYIERYSLNSLLYIRVEPPLK